MCQKNQLTDAVSRQEHLGRQATIHTCVKKEFWKECPHAAVSACGSLKHCRTTASPRTVPCVLGSSLLETNAVAPQTMESRRRAVGGVRKGNSDIRDWNRQDETEKLCLECLELFNRFGTDVGNRSLASVRMIPIAKPYGSAADDEGSARLVAAHISMQHVVQRLREGTKTASNVSSTTTRTTHPPVGTRVQFHRDWGDALKMHGVAAEFWSDFHRGARSVMVERHLRQLLWRVRKGTVMWCSAVALLPHFLTCSTC